MRDEETVEAPGTIDERSLERDPPPPATLLHERYRLSRLVGRGGMGEVIAARDEQIGRDVAIKRMRAARPSERAIQRFLREASIQGRLEHPAIVPVHEIGRDHDGLPFFAMKKLAGTTLAKLLAGDRATFPMQRVLRVFADVCLAMEFAHVRGVVHRDLNPNNVMLGDFGEVYVLDWGVAKVTGEDDGEFADVGSGSGEHATVAGTAIGTPGYMSPEQVRGELEVDGRADVYTLGCLLFEILAGERLHPASSGMASALTAIDARPSTRTDRPIAPELDELCVAATAKERDKRPTARELGDRVQRYLDGDRDVALRAKLARDHLTAARTAFDGAGDDLRGVAMREAAAALALDPALEGAASLVGRLMLEPPRTTPPEVEQAIVSDDINTARVNARAGAWAVVAGMFFMPLLWWMAPGATGYVLLLTAILVLCGAISLHSLLAPTPRTGLVAIANTVVIAMVAHMFSPLLIAPAVAAVLAFAMVVTPRFSRLSSGTAVAILMISAILGPWVLEGFDVLAVTMTAGDRGVLFQAPAVRGEAGPIFVVGALYVVVLVAGACAMGEVMRTRIRDAHKHLHLQAWQLRQLVPR
jgi:eukaryotic-like serine/threonine-protein kinase